MAAGLLACFGFAGEAVLPQPEEARLRADLEYLCSPDPAGRETGTQGAGKAAAYLAGKVQETGLTPIRSGGLGG